MTEGREFPKAPLPGVLAAVARSGKILLIKRANDPDKGKWGLPGGLVETGETPPQAAVRELFEETAVVAENGRVIDRFETRTPDGRFHYALSVVALDWVAGQGRAGSDAQDIGWFSIDRIDELPQSAHLLRIAGLVLGS